MKKRRIYDRTFKENAVKLTYERGKSQTKVIAEELGITAKILSRWRQEYKKFGTGSFCGTGYFRLTPEQTVIYNLEKKIKDSELTLDILKKGTKYVSQGYVKTKDFIENNKSAFPIIKMCNVLEVSRTIEQRSDKRKPCEMAIFPFMMDIFPNVNFNSIINIIVPIKEKNSVQKGFRKAVP